MYFSRNLQVFSSASGYETMKTKNTAYHVLNASLNVAIGFVTNFSPSKNNVHGALFPTMHGAGLEIAYTSFSHRLRSYILVNNCLQLNNPASYVAKEQKNSIQCIACCLNKPWVYLYNLCLLLFNIRLGSNSV